MPESTQPAKGHAEKIFYLVPTRCNLVLFCICSFADSLRISIGGRYNSHTQHHRKQTWQRVWSYDQCYFSFTNNFSFSFRFIFCTRHQIFATVPLCQLLRNHCTIQKIAHVQYGNVSQSTTKITSAATLVQYFRLRHQHGNKSRTAWFIFRNTRRSSVVAVRFRFPVVRSPHMLNTRSAYASEAGAWIKSKASRLNHSYLAWRAPAVRNQPKCCSGRMWLRSQIVKYWRTLGVGGSWSVKQKRQLISHVFVSFRRRFLFLF